MRRKISERGSVLLLEMLIVVSILGVLLAFSAPSFMQMRMSQQANQALATLRAIQNAESFYLQIKRFCILDCAERRQCLIGLLRHSRMQNSFISRFITMAMQTPACLLELELP